MDLITLYYMAAECTACSLHEGRLLPVFDKGNPTAKLLICGMVPADEENKVGIPFVGRAGKLLDVILARTSLTYEDVYITNLVKCYLAAGQPLQKDWIDACLPYIIMQVNILKPKVILLLGKDAAGTMLNLDAKQTLSSMQGCLYEYAKGIYAVPTYHPSYLLRTGGEKSPKFKDVLKHFEYAKELILKG
jgi:DNA polymerase